MRAGIDNDGMIECRGNGAAGIRERAWNSKIRACAFVAALILVVLVLSARGYAQSNFYQGKTITVVVGSAPGGLYDLWSRLLARTMGKYIPGNPNMLVQNM